MQIRIDLYIHGLPTHEADQKLDLILTTLAEIQRQESVMAGELDALSTQVEANNTVIGSAITLLQGLKAALDAAGTDPVKLKALSDSLAAKDQELADAIVANTPAAP